MKTAERIHRFTQEIWAWYARHKRTLPWRDLAITDATERAYCVLVSEIMLQQTQVPRVIIIYKRFTDQFPTLQALAQASNKEVIIAWRGMGYNSRALRLRDAAKMIAEEFGGVFPSDLESLRSIKGIGAYTAGAIRNFAFGIPTPCVDTNIRRVLHRTFVGPENADGTWEKDDKWLVALASDVLEAALVMERSQKPETKNQKLLRSTADWHAALMDFGSLVQTKRNPRWDICPLTKHGIMVTTPEMWRKYASEKPETKNQKPKTPSEPGRLVGSVFVPNRIFRGRIVEQLRDVDHGLSLNEIGKRITVDWNTREHKKWLAGLLKKLEQDRMIVSQSASYRLAE